MEQARGGKLDRDCLGPLGLMLEHSSCTAPLPALWLSMLKQPHAEGLRASALRRAPPPAQEAATAAAAEPAPAEHYELDPWLMDFAQLFREVLNVEPERHLDLTQIGWERLQARPPRALCGLTPNVPYIRHAPAARACGLALIISLALCPACDGRARLRPHAARPGSRAAPGMRRRQAPPGRACAGAPALASSRPGLTQA